MIKKIIYLLIFVFPILCTSCHDQDDTNPTPEVDVNTKRANITGDWFLESTIQWIRADGSIGLQNNDTLDISFLEEGNGYRYTDTSTISFNWLFQCDPDKIIIMDSSNVDPNFLGTNSNQIYAVYINKKENQTWKTTLKEDYFGWKKIEETWRLQRK